MRTSAQNAGLPTRHSASPFVRRVIGARGSMPDEVRRAMKHDAHITFRVNSHLVAAMEAEARRKHMSIPEFMRHIVRENVGVA